VLDRKEDASGLSAPQHETLTNNSGLLDNHSSIVHPLLYVLLLLFGDMLYCVTSGPKVEAGAATTKGGAGISSNTQRINCTRGALLSTSRVKIKINHIRFATTGEDSQACSLSPLSLLLLLGFSCLGLAQMFAALLCVLDIFLWLGWPQYPNLDPNVLCIPELTFMVGLAMEP
jgi:hypothetical protein